MTTRPDHGAADRLRLQQILYEDGTRQLASTDTVRDLERDELCTIKQWSDGLRYCTPDAYRTVFIDELCTMEVARRRSVEPDRRYGLPELTVANTPLPSRLYHLGTEIPRDQASFELRDGACVPRTDDADQDRFFTLGDALDRHELVHITRTSVPTGDRLVALVDTSVDGLQLPRCSTPSSNTSVSSPLAMEARSPASSAA